MALLEVYGQARGRRLNPAETSFVNSARVRGQTTRETLARMAGIQKELARVSYIDHNAVADVVLAELDILDEQGTQ